MLSGSKVNYFFNLFTTNAVIIEYKANHLTGFYIATSRNATSHLSLQTQCIRKLGAFFLFLKG